MSFYQKHKKTLDEALQAIRSRKAYSPYFEAPSSKIYGETAKTEGVDFFKACNNSSFDIVDHPGQTTVLSEKSPYGFDLKISYPLAGVEELVKASETAGKQWKNSDISERIGVCLEALDRLNKASFKMANAVMHTTGQSFVMSFQAGGTHAQDRGLEAVAYATMAIDGLDKDVAWQKQVSKQDTIIIDKKFKARGRGIGVVVGCCTFPTWNTYPGLFANLVTGNTVVVKPHPMAVLPVALTVKILCEVLVESGFEANVVLMAPFDKDDSTQQLLKHNAVKIIDYTGGNKFARWIEQNCKNAIIFTECAGVNTITIESTNDFKGMCRNIGFSLSLYSGQMCTAPQNIYIPKDGIATECGHKSFDDVVAGISSSVEKLLADDDRACQILGAVQSETTAKRVAEISKQRDIILPSRSITMNGFENARIITPVILKATGTSDELAQAECFGPICFMVPAQDGQSGLNSSSQIATEKGAITASLYSTDESYIDDASEKFAEAGVSLAINLTGAIYVNQSAAFSDYHVSGRNPAGNACLTDLSFVSQRFTVSLTRRHK